MDFKKLLTEIAPDKNGISTIEAIIASSELRKAFVTAYNERTGTNGGDSAYVSEALAFYSQAKDNATLSQCKGMDLVQCFVSCYTQGGSFDESNKLNYLFTSAVRDADKNIIGYKPDLCTAPLGGLSIAQNKGQIMYADIPQIVWDCDTYKVTQGSSFKIEHTPRTPRPANAKIIAGYVCITRFDGSKSFVIFDRQEFETWKSISRSPNSPAWGKGVLENATSMIKSKILKHSLNFTPRTTRPNHTPITSHTPVNEDGLTENNLSEEARLLKTAYEAYGSILGAYTPEEISKFITFEDFKGDVYEAIENRKESVNTYYKSLVAISHEDIQAKCPDFDSMDFEKQAKLIARLEQVNKSKIETTKNKPF